MLLFVRTFFVITTASVAYQLSLLLFHRPPFSTTNIIAIVIGAVIASLLIWIEMKYAVRFLVGIFTGILALLIGFVASYLFVQALFLIPHFQLLTKSFTLNELEEFQHVVKVGITFFFCYLALTVLYQTQHKFKLLIPFVEFSKQGSERHLILDTSVIIDGRIVEIHATHILQGAIVVSDFVLQEIQTLADSSDKQKRLRGRRGLEILSELRQNKSLNIQVVYDDFPKIKETDGKLVALAKKMEGIIITNDYNLKKVAQLQNVEVINLNALAAALKPHVLPGETLQIEIIKPGGEADQGIGYLEDGTVVIVEHGRKHIGKQTSVLVTNVLQNNVGRMVFGKINS